MEGHLSLLMKFTPWKKGFHGCGMKFKNTLPHKGALFVRCLNLSGLSTRLPSTPSGSLPMASSRQVCEGWMSIPGLPTPQASYPDWMSPSRESTLMMPAPPLGPPVFTGWSWSCFLQSIDGLSHCAALGSHHTAWELPSGWKLPSRLGWRDLKTYTRFHDCPHRVSPEMVDKER